MNKRIRKAFAFAKKKHKGQKDDSGKGYFYAHCFQVFQILLRLKVDHNLLCAGLLHDTIEDTETSYMEIVAMFNKDIADLVMEVTHEGDKKTGYYFPRLKTKRGIILKFADRLSNISRMDCWPEDRQQHYLKKSKFWKLKLN